GGANCSKRRRAASRARRPLCTRARRPVASPDRTHDGDTPMTISMHSASVPVFIRMFNNMTTWLDKAEAHAQAKKFEPSVYLTARLAPDMLPFLRQIQMASDAAKFAVARLAGVEAPKFEDNETNFAELRERIAKTVAFIKSVPADHIDGTEDKDIALPRRD